jgi:large subunit ribosomal protein L24
MHIRKGDLVVVISGDDADRTRTHRVLRVLPAENKVVVEGINRVYKHRKQSRQHPGGRLSKEMPISMANVQLYCPSCKRGVRTGCRYAADGHKELFCRNRECQATIRVLSRARSRYAAKSS